MRSKVVAFAVATGLLLAASAFGQGNRLDPRDTMKVAFPDDSPVALMGADWGDSHATNRGGAMLLELRANLTLRNVSGRRIRGVALQITAQEVTPGGKQGVLVPSIDVKPGEVFPVSLDLRLLRPMQSGDGPLVQVDLDCVLFSDLTKYGPNKVNSYRSLKTWEIEARRDREYFKSVLQTQGANSLQDRIVASLRQQDQRAQINAQVTRIGRVTALEAERESQVSFLQVPDAPVEPTGGLVKIAGNEAHQPTLAVKNKTDRPIRFIEMGWLVRDAQGREYSAGALPAEVHLQAGQQSRMLPTASLSFSQNGRPLRIQELTGFVSNVEFADGQVWVPNRAALSDVRLLRALAPSPEEQRLAQLYRVHGLSALIEELNKF